MTFSVPYPESGVTTAAAFLITAGSWGTVELLLVLRDWRAGTRRLENQDRNSAIVIMAGIGGTLIAAFAASRVFSSLALGPAVICFAAGILFMWLGIALRVWAVRTLGKFFRLVVVIQADHRVIQSGPYAVLRHPSYAGAWLTLIGVGLCLDNLASIALCLLIPPFAFLPRVRAEEAALHQSLGAEYLEYSRKTRRLIPGIW